MLVIRMQRTGRSGYAMFRMVVQDARRSPTSGSVVAYLGSYDPHAKSVQIDKEKTGFYLEHGAQPSPRVVAILKSEKVKLPKWVAAPRTKQRKVRHPEKRRSTAPAQPAAAEPAAEEKLEEEPVTDAQPQANTPETAAEPAIEPAAEEKLEEEPVTDAQPQANTPETAAEPAEITHDQTDEAGAEESPSN